MSAVFANAMYKPHFVAPEQVATNKYGSAVDRRACKMMMYAMFTGRLPFPSADVLRLYASGDFTIKYDQPVWQYVLAESLALTKMLLCKDPDRRISVFQSCTIAGLSERRPRTLVIITSLWSRSGTV